MLLNKSDSSGDIELTIRKFRELYKSTEAKIDLENEPYLQSSIKHIEKYWKGGKKGFFLEAGCGTAKNCLLLAKKGAKVVGLDISMDALKLAKTIFGNEGQRGFFVCGNMLRLPFKDNSFRLIYAGGSIEHIKDTKELVCELYRVLENGGLLTATVPFVSFSTLTYGQLSGNIPDVPILKQLAEFLHIELLKGRYMMYGYEKSFTSNKLRKIFRKAGFNNIKIGLFETYYEIKFFKSEFMKNILRKLALKKLFWPMVYINGEKMMQN